MRQHRLIGKKTPAVTSPSLPAQFLLRIAAMHSPRANNTGSGCGSEILETHRADDLERLRWRITALTGRAIVRELGIVGKSLIAVGHLGSMGDGAEAARGSDPGQR